MNLTLLAANKRMFSSQAVVICILLSSLATALLPVFQSQSDSNEILTEVDASWKQSLPIKISGQMLTRRNKEVQAKRAESWQLTDKGHPYPGGPLQVVSAFEWVHNGLKIASSTKTLSPEVLSQSKKVLPGGWDRTETWDGINLNTATVSSVKDVPAQVNIIPAALPEAADAIPSVAKIGSDLLLCAPNGQSWKDYLHNKKLTVQRDVVWQGAKSTALSWQEDWDQKVTYTLYSVPTKRFAMVGCEIADKHGELRVSTKVNLKELATGMWLPTSATQTVYTVREYYGDHLPSSTIQFELHQIESAKNQPDSTFRVNEEDLPKGSKITDLKERKSHYVGSQVTDADILKMVSTLKLYLKGEANLQSVHDCLPKQKKVSFPSNCGPNSLLAICALYDVDTSSQELAKLAGTDVDGITSMKGMVDALKAKGLEADALKMSMEDLKAVKLPCIVYIEPSHFAVLLKFDSGQAVLLDPPTRIVQGPVDEFQKIWGTQALIIHGHSTAIEQSKVVK